MELLVYDDFKWIHIMGPLLAIIAMLALGKSYANKEQGKEVHPIPAVILIAVAMIFHFFLGEGTLLDRVSIMMADFGIGMILNSGYLLIEKVNSKPFWGLGIVALVSGVVIYSVVHIVGFVWNGMKNGFSDPIPGQVLVELGPDDNIKELSAIIMKYNAKVEKAFPEVDLAENEDLAQYFLVELPDEEQTGDFLKEIQKDEENVDQADMNYEMALFKPITGHIEPAKNTQYTADDPMISSQWWLNPEKVNPVHNLLKENNPSRIAKVAIVDTGVDGGHEDLKSIFHKSPGDSDKNGHGTHCAGLAGAATNNGLGMASFNWEGKFVEVSGYPALSPEGRGTVETVANAIIAATEDGADVISLSLGGPHRKAPKAQSDAIKYAQSRGAIVIVAAGNSNSDARYYSPANIKGVICVAAIDRELNKAGFSNINTGLEFPIAAPGVDIFSLVPGGKYAPMSGTSMATPIVAGLVGILKSFDPDLTGEQAFKILNETGININDASKTGKMINPEAAIRKVLE